MQYPLADLSGQVPDQLATGIGRDVLPCAESRILRYDPRQAIVHYCRWIKIPGPIAGQQLRRRSHGMVHDRVSSSAAKVSWNRCMGGS